MLLLLLALSAAQADVIGSVDFTKVRPVEFLDHLRKECCGSVTVYQAPKDWITAEDVRELKKFLKDKRPTACTLSIFSSILCEKSTVQREALFMIQGYNEKRYPPLLHSGQLDLKKVKIPK